MKRRRPPGPVIRANTTGRPTPGMKQADRILEVVELDAGNGQLARIVQVRGPVKLVVAAHAVVQAVAGCAELPQSMRVAAAGFLASFETKGPPTVAVPNGGCGGCIIAAALGGGAKCADHEDEETEGGPQ